MSHPLILGERMPSTTSAPRFDIEIGMDNQLLSWRPFGAYQFARFQFVRNLPAVAEIRVAKSHPMAERLLSIRRQVVSIRTHHNGIPWDGRVMNATCKGKPGREIVTAYCVSNFLWFSSILAWPQPLFPRAEFQFPKHDIGFGNRDFVFKYFTAKNATRLRAPVYCKLPIRNEPTTPLPDLNTIDTVDDLLDYMADATDDLIAVWARMTPLDELFKQHLANGRRELTINLWRPGDPHPGTVFNADTLGRLENIISWEGLENFFHFLNPGNLLGLANPSSWLSVDKPCYLVDTRPLRDRRHMEWRLTDGGPIIEYERAVAHPEGYQVIVGGKAPEIANTVVRMVINGIIKAIAGALGGIIAPIVGDLFNDVFFAFNQFTDPDLKAELGSHALPEKFADSTSAFSLDALSAGTAKLKAIGGQDTLKLTVLSGVGGYTFGVDDGSGTHFELGDIMRFTDGDTIIEQHVEAVEVVDDPRSLMTETVTLGADPALGAPWERIIGKLGQLTGAINAAAVSTT